MSLPGYKDLPRHESYGLAHISRVQGSMNLFGSPIRPHHFIVLRISEGEAHHGLGSTGHMDGRLIAEVAMSEVQFAELITTMNCGVGTPCTLLHTWDGQELKKHESPPQQQSEAQLTREEFRRRVEDRMASMKSVRRQIEKLLSEAKLAQSRRAEITSTIDRLLGLFTDSAPFFMERFEENAEKVIAHAKAEITAHADLVARSTGVQSLQSSSVPLLSEKEES